MYYEGDLSRFSFSPEAIVELRKFKPDAIYCQNEAYCVVSSQMMIEAKRMGTKFILFAWENIHPYSAMNAGIQYLLKDCDLVVCGSGEAQKLVAPYNKKTLRCIQVGVDTQIFRLMPEVEKDRDIVFVGRNVPEKGMHILERAVAGTGMSVLWPNGERVPYYDLPARYNRAKVHVAPSYDTSDWKEQAPGGYASLEALCCGLHNVTTDSAAMMEGLQTCPGVAFPKQRDPDGLRVWLEVSLRTFKEYGPNLAGREWVIKTYGNEAIAKTLEEAFLQL